MSDCQTDREGIIGATSPDWPSLPTETEIYIMPSGEIIVADLPIELAAQLAALLPRNNTDLPLEPPQVIPFEP